MTGPAVPSDDDLREALASEMPKHLQQCGAGYELACSCGWRGPSYVQAHLALGYIFRLHVADALLPVVRAYADQRAAEELRAAARSPVNGSGGRPLGWLLERADALAGGRLNGQANTETGDPGELPYETLRRP